MPHGLPIGQMVDPYRVLGVSPEAGEEAIQAAYRRLARAFHPDVNHTPEAGARMREINAAYALLRDRTRRAGGEHRGRQLPVRDGQVVGLDRWTGADRRLRRGSALADPAADRYRLPGGRIWRAGSGACRLGAAGGQ